MYVGYTDALRSFDQGRRSPTVSRVSTRAKVS